MLDKLINYIRAGFACLYIVSPEENRVEAEIRQVAENLKYSLFAWSVTSGYVNPEDGNTQPAQDPLEATEAIGEFPEKTLILLRDFHVFLEDPNPVLTRALKDAIDQCRAQGKVIIFVGCRQVLPPELEREITVMDFQLPGKPELEQVIQGITESADVDMPESDLCIQLTEAASGLTCLESENAYALSVVETGGLDPAVVAREKANTVKKNGLLEVIEVKQGLDDIGGLDQLKAWMIKRKDAFTQRAIEYGLPSPKGCLIIGIPGTGKSLSAQATASVFGRPLLKLDAGNLFGSLVGQSEQNMRTVIQTAEAIAPCVLWIDEIEKGFAGSKSSGFTDGGTSSRVLGSFIGWMQDKTAPVFVVATANDVTQLPPEFLRKGRWDELWFVDLPNLREREAIWRIQIARYGRDPDKFDVSALAKATEGYTGSEIEQIFVDTLYAAFAKNQEPGTVTVSSVLTDAVPLCKLMSEQVGNLRKWAKGRARPATTPVDEPRGRKMAA